FPSVTTQPFALLRAFDGRWYAFVATHGYLVLPRHQSDTAFFPLYASLLHVLHLSGLGILAAGVALSNLALLGGLVALYELARCWLPEADARRTAVYAALFPLGYVFSMVYPESLVLAACALAGLLAWRGRWTGAAVAAAAAA